ncbi:outer membrane lipoprotein carrier protein LolA [Pseudoruegeria sp. SK021]|uniref:LolA family protein n=1 Tax=Pseudoruegeria sp. SK021 TaxID=1933035 RepID=UPI000A2427B1|nr:outer membrane lipoprotein carrier protein LolA [Pseudoruegeria sp. SK021]OSP55051.1 cell envelope biogenesis protein LolA [Pseudoruegeria sp. SK021]
MKHLILALSCLFALPAHADKLPLSTLSAYINTIDADKAQFTQINGDGSRNTGTLYLKRPGRARFEYDAPMDDTLVLASGSQVAIFDGRGAVKPEQYPLKRTPLNLILARNVDLTRAKMVTGHGEEKGRTIVQAQDPEHPEYGKIYLYFEPSPLRLAEWLIVSDTGEQTRVILEPFTPVSDMSPFLFDIAFETRQRQ